MLGNTPHIFRGGQIDPSRLFFSKPELAFTKGISIPGGFGVLPAGTIMAKVTESTGKLGKYIPYTPEAPSAGLTYGFGLLYITETANGTDVYVTMNDSYKVAVGDHLAIADADSSGASATDCGAVTAIDRTTYSHMAVITVTNSIANSTYTVAQGAALFIQSKTSQPFTAAVGVLYGAVDTGVGENAKGGDGVLILKNAMLYVDMLYNYDSEVLTDLGATVDAQYLIL